MQEDNQAIRLLSQPSNDVAGTSLKKAIKKNNAFVVVMLIGCVLLTFKVVGATNLIKPDVVKVIPQEEEIIERSINTIYESPRFQADMKREAEKKYWESIKDKAEENLNKITNKSDQPVTHEKAEAMFEETEAGSIGMNAGAGVPTQHQKDETAAVCKKVGENRADFYSKYGVSYNQFIDICYYDLLAIAWKESRFNCNAKGDGGKSYGCFQIQVNMHGLSINQAANYSYAAEWTIDRLVRDDGYPRYRTNALARHNGSGQAALNYAEAVKKKSSEFRASGL